MCKWLNGWECSPSWEANSCTQCQDVPRILWDRNVHDLVHNSPNHLSVSWTRSVHFTLSHPLYIRRVLISRFHLCLGLPSRLLPSDVSIWYPVFMYPAPTHVTCPAHLFLLGLSTPVTFTKRYKSSYSSTSCSFLQFLVFSSLLQDVFPSTLFPHTFSLCKVWKQR